jgi:CRP-like cAMP-binding protein
MTSSLEEILPKDKAKELIELCKLKIIDENALFLRASETPKKIAYVEKGLFRYVYINDKGDEFTKGLIPEGSFISSYSAMISKTPSYFSIEALEESKIMEFSWTGFNELLSKDSFWLRFLLMLVEKGYTIKEKRERDLLLLDAETRYINFLKDFPGMDQRIKQSIIASYLGIKPETLSRIRKKITY